MNEYKWIRDNYGTYRYYKRYSAFPFMDWITFKVNAYQVKLNKLKQSSIDKMFEDWSTYCRNEIIERRMQRARSDNLQDLPQQEPRGGWVTDWEKVDYGRK